jgi:hypothetical protein
LLSVVSASRNDGHGVHALERTQVFIDGLAEQSFRYKRPVELILVEWNPPKDARPLAEVLTAPTLDGFTVRIVTVPPEIHEGLGGPARLHFYQMIAKNAGIRRATGDSVLATNIDILLSDDLFLCSTKRLHDFHAYRADRMDVRFDPAISTDPRLLRTSEPIRIHRRHGLEHPGHGITDPYVVELTGLLSQLSRRPLRLLEKIVGPNSQTGPPGIPRLRRGFCRVFVLPRIHGNACGDFTLMTRTSWERIQGYPEWVLHSWNLDSLLLYQVAAAGYSFVDLDGCPCIHLEHSGGWTPDAAEALFNFLEREGVHTLPTYGLIDVAHSMWKGRAAGAWRTNLSSWGLGKHRLVESRPRSVVK